MQVYSTSRPPHFREFCLLHPWSIHQSQCMHSKTESDMFAAVCFLGTCIVPKIHVFRGQSCVIQCMLIVMKLSNVGLVQKSVVKAMSVLTAISSISHLMSARNARLCFSTDLVTLCLDMLSHLGSQGLMNFTNLAWVPMCKGNSPQHTSASGWQPTFYFLHSYAQTLLHNRPTCFALDTGSQSRASSPCFPPNSPNELLDLRELPPNPFGIANNGCSPHV